jgi:CRISPR-associated protein Cmr6
MRNSVLALASSGRSRGQHPGLLLQRFLAHSADGSERWSAEKRDLLIAAIEAAGNSDLRALYKSAFVRWEKSLTELTVANDLRTEARLIVGLGSESVLETGIRLHHTYGLPVIPGSALKGLAAHYCHDVWGQLSAGDAGPAECKKFRRPTAQEDEEYRNYLHGNEDNPDDNYYRLLFGTTDDSGCVIFHDVWLTPDSANPLVMDVMTPHHPKWLDGAVPPTDFDSPVPVPFVSVDGTFRVAVSWRGPMSEQASRWTELAFDLLAEALRQWGVGGKTTSGYGRLIEVDASRRRKAFSAEALGLPAVGTVVIATLLDAPKRSKPWRAKLALRTGKDLAGPIEPTERSPADAAPGKVVRLVVGYVDEKSIRFTWPG